MKLFRVICAAIFKSIQKCRRINPQIGIIFFQLSQFLLKHLILSNFSPTLAFSLSSDIAHNSLQPGMSEFCS